MDYSVHNKTNRECAHMKQYPPGPYTRTGQGMRLPCFHLSFMGADSLNNEAKLTSYKSLLYGTEEHRTFQLKSLRQLIDHKTRENV